MLKDKYSFKYSAGQAINLKYAIDQLCATYTFNTLPSSSKLSRNTSFLSHIVNVSLMRDFSIRLGKKLAESKPKFTIHMKQSEALAYLALYLEKKIIYNTATAQIATSIHQDI